MRKRIQAISFRLLAVAVTANTNKPTNCEWTEGLKEADLERLELFEPL